MADDETYEDFDVNASDFAYAMGQGGNFRRQTKEQQIYGVWADIDEEDEGRSERAATNSFFSGSKKKASYTTPVSFVSGGVKQGSGVTKEAGEGDEDEDKKEDAQEEDVIHAVPKKRSKTAPQQREMGAHVFAGMRSSTKHGSADGAGMADWAKKSGKGNVIMQMMQNMGYVPGQGLGANKQGIVEPVQAKVRPGRAALGAYGKEAQGPKFGESAAEAQRRTTAGGDVEETEEVAPKRESWKKANAGRKIKYKTIDEVIREEGESGGTGIGGGAGVKIIDMTGPEQRVYNDYNSFSKRTRAPEADSDRKKFDVPELTYNLNTLLDLTEDEIRRNDRHVRFLKDQTEVLKEDKKQLETKLGNEREELRRMQEVLEIVEKFKEMSRSTSLTLDDCKNLFQRLRDDYAPEFQLFGLDAIALTNVLPMLKSFFASWDPLDPEQVDRGYEVLEEWEDILKVNKNAMFDDYKSDKDSLSAFDRCVWEAWMPPIRRAALAWNAKTNGPQMINVVETWISPRRASNPREPDRPPLLPGWIVENLLDQVVLPRIKEQVDQWNPLTDHIPIDSWLLPWRPIMGDRLSPVYPPIRQKLSKALREWHPQDPSALAILRPWNNVFSAGTMQSFLSMNIVPKLQQFIAGMNLNPLQNTQYLEYHTVIDWMELISSDIVCQILVNNFFPRWYENLCMWLEAPGRILDEIKAYYQEWMERFPEKLRLTKPIRDEFARALFAMDRAKRGLPVRTAPPGAAPVGPPGPAIPPGFVRAPAPPPMPPVSAPANMRQLAEQWARERGIVFVPQLNKFEQGRPVYLFGSVSVYFEGTAILAFNPTTRQWMPIALEDLVHVAR